MPAKFWTLEKVKDKVRQDLGREKSLGGGETINFGKERL